MFEIMRGARQFLAQNQDIIPLHHVEEILSYGSVEMYVVAGGANVHTEEGNRTLAFEMALYLLCLELCNLGLGNQPYQPHPYLHDPIVGEEQGEAEAPMEDHAPEQPGAAAQDDDQPGHPKLEQAAAGAPPAPNIPQLVQPLHWVFAEPPPEIKPEPNQEPPVGLGEYIEPFE
jgi:hypothetical protein